MKRILFPIFVIAMAFSLGSCYSNDKDKQQISTSVSKPAEAVTDSMEIKRKIFYGKLMADRKNVPEDSTRITNLVNSSMFETKSSPEKDYITFFNYWSYTTSEDASEGIAQGTYEIFLKYPEKWNEFNGYCILLPDSLQKDIRDDVASAVISSMILTEDQCTVEEFKKKFPYLDTPDYIKMFYIMKKNNSD